MSGKPTQEVELYAPQPLPPTISIGGQLSPEAGRQVALTNIKATGREGLRMAMLCTGDATASRASAMAHGFAVKWYYCHWVEYAPSASGEVSSGVRTVLVSPDLQTLVFGSEGVVQSLDLIRQFLGDGPWDPPIRVRLVEVVTSNKNRLLKLEVIDDEPSKTSAKDRSRS